MILAAVLICVSTAVRADAPDIVDVVTTRSGQTWRFDVTIAHPDTGWDHYADGWQVELADGTVLGTRVLAHPHETEQPFTRSLDGIAIPENVTQTFVRARCLTDGWNNATTAIELR